MKRWLALAAICAWLTVPVQAQTVEQEGDWLLVCNTDAACTIIGAPRPEALPDYPRVEMRFYRGPEQHDVLLANTFLADAHGDPHPDASTLDGLSLSMESMSVPLFHFQMNPLVSGPANYDYFSIAQSAELATAISEHAPAYVRSGFGAFASMPVGDLGALLRRMDRVQAAAWEAREGEAPDDFTSAAPTYELFPRDEVELPELHPDLLRPCRRTTDVVAHGYALDHTTEPTLLVLVRCGGRERLYIWYPSGEAEPRRLRLERERQRGATAMAAEFDPDSGILTLLDHPPGRTDCGVRTRWGWVDGEGFVLLSTARMPLCRAIRPERWPEVFSQQGWMVR